MNPGLRRKLPLLATAGIFLALFVAAGFIYHGFFSARTVVNLFVDNAFLGVAAVGMTLVIFAGGIDLSVGAVIGFTSIFTATLVEQRGFHPAVAMGIALGVGALFGAGMGVLIHVFKQPPFLITLAGMFLARGGAYWISTEQISVTHPLYGRLAEIEWAVTDTIRLPLAALILGTVLIGGYVVAHFTRFGRNLFAVGGNEQSALLMGLPVGVTKIGVYTLNSTLAALAGQVATMSMASGNSRLGIGLELDAIAIVVIGGTLLSGGRGHMLGTLLGILVFGTIQAAILFDGRLDPGWIRIVVAGLLLGFILLQRTLVRSAGRQ